MLKLHLPDMSCSHCREYVEVAVHGIDQSAILQFDMESRSVTIDTKAAEGEVIKVLAEAGFVSRTASWSHS